ncbi:MAG: cytochrome c oxidase assembly protein [Solirubrobacterales bacterium]|nr:cytochrome c oxidase assembly protein [Solirubrobacterales bacterium]
MSAPALPALLVSQWQPTAAIALPALAAGGLYAGATRRVRERWPRRRTLSFVAGVGCVIVALQSGIARYDDQLLAVHMVQHMLLLLAAPLLLLGGRPWILLLSALAPEQRRPLARALQRTRAYTAPVPALACFSAVVVLTHLPAFYDAALRSPALHAVEHGLYLLAGMLMWSPLIDGDPAPRHRLSGLGRLVYLIVAMMPMAVVGAYLNRHATLLYPAYGPTARALGISALDDQAQAGAIMWVLGDVIMVAVGLWAALAAMLAEERRQLAREARTVP